MMVTGTRRHILWCSRLTILMSLEISLGASNVFVHYENKQTDIEKYVFDAFKHFCLTMLTKRSNIQKRVRPQLTKAEWRIYVSVSCDILVPENGFLSVWCQSIIGTDAGVSLDHWASCKIRKIAGCACAANAGNVLPASDYSGNR